MHEIHDKTLLGILAQSPEILIPKTDDVEVSMDTEEERMEAVAKFGRQLEQKTNSYSLSIDLLTGSLKHVEGTFAVFATDWQVDDFDYYAGADENGKQFYTDVIQGGPHDSYADRLIPFIGPNVTVLEPGIETTEWGTEWGDEIPPLEQYTVEPLEDATEHGERQLDGPEIWPVTFASDMADPTVRFFERVPFSEPVRTVDDLQRELDEIMENPPYWEDILPRAERIGKEIVETGGMVPSLHETHQNYGYHSPSE